MQDNYSFDTIKVKSSSGIAFMIPTACSLEYRQHNRADSFTREFRDKDHTLSSTRKLNKIIEQSDASDTGTRDIISCEGTDALWNIVIGKFPNMPSINESNYMSECVMFGEILNKLHQGRAGLIKCELENDTIGTNNLFTEFNVYGDNDFGNYKRFVYNFYHKNHYYNIFGQCHFDGSNDCESVSQITSIIAKSFGKMIKLLPIILILSFSSNVFSDKKSYKNLVDKTNNTNERIAVCIPVYVEMSTFYEYVLIKQLEESNSEWKKTANMLRNSLSREFFSLDLIEGDSSLENLKDSAWMNRAE